MGVKFSKSWYRIVDICILLTCICLSYLPFSRFAPRIWPSHSTIWNMHWIILFYSHLSCFSFSFCFRLMLSSLLMATAVLVAGIIWSLILCHYGTFATGRIQSNDLTACNAKWLSYPLNLRKYIILINRFYWLPFDWMQFGNNGQGAWHISLFRSFILSIQELKVFMLDFVTQIVKSAASYYIIFRQISQR